MLALLAAIAGIVFVVLGLAGTISLSTGIAIGLICVLAEYILSFVETRVGVRGPNV